MHSCYEGHLHITKFLVTRKADINATANVSIYKHGYEAYVAFLNVSMRLYPYNLY